MKRTEGPMTAKLCQGFMGQALRPDRCKECLRPLSAHALDTYDDVKNSNVTNKRHSVPSNYDEHDNLNNNRRRSLILLLDNSLPNDVTIRTASSEFTGTGPLILKTSNLNTTISNLSESVTRDENVAYRSLEQEIPVNYSAYDENSMARTSFRLDEDTPLHQVEDTCSEASSPSSSTDATSIGGLDTQQPTSAKNIESLELSLAATESDEQVASSVVQSSFHDELMDGGGHTSPDRPKRPLLVRDLRLGKSTTPLSSKFDTRHPSSPPPQGKTFQSAFSPPRSPPPDLPSPDTIDLNTTIVIEASKYKDDVKRATIAERAGKVAESRVGREKKREKTKKEGDIDAAYVEELEEDLFELEDRCESLEKENKSCKRDLMETQNSQEDIQKRYEHLRGRLASLEEKQHFLEEENKTLNERFRLPESERYPEADLEMKLRQSERMCELLQEENETLRNEIENLQLEMEEMHDQFREENDVIAFRELQQELEATAKNCRILQFKLRKAERKNSKLEQERSEYEERARKLEAHIQCEDDKLHIKELEDELRMAKEVSVRLHDELEMTEERKSKYEDECGRLKDRVKASESERAELNTQMERLKNEMERLRADLIDQGACDQSTTPIFGPTISITTTRDRNDTRLSPLRAPSLGNCSRQSSTEHDVAQLMRDLSDSKERELDLKEQLKFAEEEIRITRGKLSELEEENESLVLQLRKMAQKKELRRGSAIQSDTDDFTESEAECDPKLHMELAEQEMNVLRRKMAEIEKQNETLTKELTLLQRRLTEKEKEVCELLQTDPEDSLARKSTLLSAEIETLKWRLIEKDREIDRLAKLAQTTKPHGAKLKKSRSLDSDNTLDLRKQLELVTHEAAILNERLRDIDEENDRLTTDNNKLLLIAKKRVPNMSLDDPKVENVMLKDKIEYLQLEVQRLKGGLRQAESTLAEAGLAKTDVSTSETPDETRVKEKLQSAEEEIVKLRRRMSDLTKEHNELLVRMKKRRDKAKKLDDLSVEELKDEIEDLDDEISELKQRIKAKEDSTKKFENELESKTREAEAIEYKFKKREKDLLEELNGLEQKNEILSNLLEALQNRDSKTTFVDTTSSIASSPDVGKLSSIDRSPSLVSTLSDVSTGSDEVFHDGRYKTLTDTEKCFRLRLEYLEKLLQQERSKTKQQGGLVEQANTLTREKALLQSELEICKKQLAEAHQKVTEMNSRLSRIQSTHQSIQGNFDTVAKELEGERDRRQIEDEKRNSTNLALRQENEDLQERLVVYMKKVEELSAKLGNLQNRSSTAVNEMSANVAVEFTRDLENMRERCNSYSVKTEELQMELRKMSDKYELLAKDRAQLQSEWRSLLADVHDKDEALNNKTEALNQKELELKQRESTIANKDSTIEEKNDMLKQKEDIIRTYESSSKQRESELKRLRDQVSQKEVTLKQQDEKIRQYGDSLRQRDDRLREKDDIIHQLNNKLQQNKQDLTVKEKDLNAVVTKLKDKEADLAKLTERLGGDNGVTSLHDRIETIQEEKNKLSSEVKTLKSSRDSLENEKRTLEIDNQHLKDKIKVAEISRTTYSESRVVKTLLEEKSKLVQEKQRLERDLESIRSKRGPDQDKLEKMMDEKSNLLADANDVNERLQMEIKMVTTKLESTNTALSDANDREDNLSSLIKKLELEIKTQREQLEKRLQREEQMSEIEVQALKASYEDRLNVHQNEIQRLRNELAGYQLEDEARTCVMEDLEMHLEASRKRYHKDLTAWEIEKNNLVKKLAEINEKKKDVSRLNRSVDELKCELLEAEVARSDMQHRFAMEKAAWNTEKLDLQNRLAQLEELTREPTERHGKFKDLKAKLEKHARMEVVFDKERTDHKKLLTEAQQMANKLQEQLKESDLKRASEKRELQTKHSEQQLEWEVEREELETRIAQYEANAQRFTYMLSKMDELERKARHTEEVWRKEKRELVTFLQRLQTCLATEREHLARLVSELKIVQDVTPLLENKVSETPTKKDDRRNANYEMDKIAETLDAKFHARLKQVLVQLVQVTDDITKHYTTSKDEVTSLCQLKSLTNAESTDSLFRSYGRTSSVESHASVGSCSSEMSSAPYVGLSHAYKSYLTAGTQSCDGSRSGTPERYSRRGFSNSPARRGHLPHPPPSFIIRPTGSNTSLPLMRSTDNIDTKFDPNDLSESTQSLTVKPGSVRGRPLLKSYSVDMQQKAWPTLSRGDSSDSTDIKYEKVKAFIEENGKKRQLSQDRLAIDLARRRFFEGGYDSGDSGFNSWPDRKKLHAQSTPVITQIPEEVKIHVEVVQQRKERESKIASLSRDIRRQFQSITSLTSKKSLSPKGSVKGKDKVTKSPVTEKKKDVIEKNKDDKKSKDDKKIKEVPKVKDEKKSKEELKSKDEKKSKEDLKAKELAKKSSKDARTEGTEQTIKDAENKEKNGQSSSGAAEEGAVGGKAKADDKRTVSRTLKQMTPSIFSSVAQRRQMFQQKAKSVDSGNGHSIAKPRPTPSGPTPAKTTAPKASPSATKHARTSTKPSRGSPSTKIVTLSSPKSRAPVASSPTQSNNVSAQVKKVSNSDAVK